MSFSDFTKIPCQLTNRWNWGGHQRWQTIKILQQVLFQNRFRSIRKGGLSALGHMGIPGPEESVPQCSILQDLPISKFACANRGQRWKTRTPTVQIQGSHYPSQTTALILKPGADTGTKIRHRAKTLVRLVKQRSKRWTRAALCGKTHCYCDRDMLMNQCDHEEKQWQVAGFDGLTKECWVRELE